MKRFLLSALAVALMLSSANAAPITATIISGYSTDGYPTGDGTRLVVNGPAGVETHYLAWDIWIDETTILISPNGKIAVRIWGGNYFADIAYYVLDHLSGPGTYGAVGSPSPATPEFRFDNNGAEFTERLRARYEVDFVRFRPLSRSWLTQIDKHGNIYGSNFYEGVFGATYEKSWLNRIPWQEETQNWKNFQPYLIPEPSTTVFVPLGLGALALGHRFLKNRRP